MRICCIVESAAYPHLIKFECAKKKVKRHTIIFSEHLIMIRRGSLNLMRLQISIAMLRAPMKIVLSKLAQEEEKQHALDQLHSQDFENWFDEDVEGFSNRDLRFRKDVILKRIIRSCKKFYSKEFQRFVGKTRQTFVKIKQDRERIFKYAREFLNLKFGDNTSEEMEFILFWFIDKKVKEDCIEDCI